MSVSVDFAARRVDGGFFIRNDRKCSPYTWSDVQDPNYEVVGTIAENESTLRDALLRLIRGARRRVFVASFLMGDDLVIAELLRAAERLRGGVYVICALKRDSIKRGLVQEGEEGVPPEERQKDFRRLTMGGVSVRGHGDCHAKFAVADSDVALVGSANFVRNSFEVNNELSVVIRDPIQVDQAARLFTELWHSGCAWEIPPGGPYRVARRKVNRSPRVPAKPALEGNELVWTNENKEDSLLRSIQSIVDEAKQHVTLASYSISGMSKSPSLLFECLERAIGRGVSVRLHLRQRNSRPREMTDVLAAHDMGVEIHGDIKNHAKAVIADRSSALVFSANFDAEHGLTSGVEAGVWLKNPTAVERAAEYFDHLIASANTDFVRDPTLADLDRGLAARWYSQWRGPEVMTVAGSEARRFVDACYSGACFFEKSGDHLRLYINNLCAELRTGSNEAPATVHSLMTTQPAHERLMEWMSSPRSRGRADREKRGFFPARLSLCD